MKFDPLVKFENDKLVNIADEKEISTDIKVFTVQQVLENSSDYRAFADSSEKNILAGIKLTLKDVELAPETPDEEKLAALREQLKALEEKQKYIVLVSEKGSEIKDADDCEEFIKAMVHSARRLKDCTVVTGFGLSSELLKKDKAGGINENSWSIWFINEMNVKHGHYVYFADFNESEKNGLNADCSKNQIVLYKTV